MNALSYLNSSENYSMNAGSAVIYTSHLNPANFGCAKASGSDDRKQGHITNMNLFPIVQSRELSREPKFQDSGGTCIEPSIAEIRVNAAIKIQDFFRKKCSTFKMRAAVQFLRGEFQKKKMRSISPEDRLMSTPIYASVVQVSAVKANVFADKILDTLTLWRAENSFNSEHDCMCYIIDRTLFDVDETTKTEGETTILVSDKAHLLSEDARIQSIAVVYIAKDEYGCSVKIDSLATAIWNLKDEEDPRKVKGAGTAAIEEAIFLSFRSGGKGRVQLTALKSAVSFYTKLGFKQSRTCKLPYVLELLPEDVPQFLRRFGARAIPSYCKA